MKKRPSITLLTVLLAMVFAAGIGVYSSYIGMKIYQESSDHLLESFSQISETFTLFVQRNWTVLSQWDGQLKNADIDHADSIGADMQANKESWHYSDFYLFNESTQYLTADGRRGSADSISGVIQEMYSEGGPIVSTYTASYGVPKIAFALPPYRTEPCGHRPRQRHPDLSEHSADSAAGAGRRDQGRKLRREGRHHHHRPGLHRLCMDRALDAGLC